MAEVFVTFTTPTSSDTGDLYWARALGRKALDGLWEGWLEFTLAGTEDAVRTARETEQPNRNDLLYWAKGLTAIYLEGALQRALHPEPVLADRESSGHRHLSAEKTSSRPADRSLRSG